MGGWEYQNIVLLTKTIFTTIFPKDFYHIHKFGVIGQWALDCGEILK